MITLDPGALNRRVRVERPVADDSFNGAGSGEWEPVATVRASVQDALPSRAERLTDGFNTSARPARVRMRFRDDVTPDMRFAVLRKSGGVDIVVRLLQIISGPAELGQREGLEFMTEEYRPAGNLA